MKNKKGFTLIELIAVILVLGVIAMIAIPTVNTIVGVARRDSFLSSATNVLEAVEDECQLQLLKKQEIVYEYTIKDNKITPIVDIKGKLPDSGTIYVTESCEVKFVNVTDGNFYANKDYSDEKITITDYDGEDVTEPDDPDVTPNPDITPTPDPTPEPEPEPEVKYTAYNVGDKVSLDPGDGTTRNWYVIKNSGDTEETVTVIMEKNLVDNISSGDIYSELKSRTSLFTNAIQLNGTYDSINYSGYNARFISASDITSITGNTSWTNNKDNSFSLETNTSGSKTLDKGKAKYKWLFNYTSDCTKYGCDEADSSESGYWTSSKASNYFWVVKNDGTLNAEKPVTIIFIQIPLRYGIRPVIEINKSYIK